MKVLKNSILKIKNYQKTVAFYITIKYNNVINLLYKLGGNKNNDYYFSIIENLKN